MTSKLACSVYQGPRTRIAPGALHVWAKEAQDGSEQRASRRDREVCLVVVLVALLGIARPPGPGRVQVAASKCNKDAHCCSGLVCQDDSCQSGCRIGGVFYAAGATNGQCQSCQPAISSTSWTNRANGATCNDGNACTTVDTCQAGTCTGTTPVICPPNINPCVSSAGTCNTTTGQCGYTAQPDGTACNDGNACTSADQCQAGNCTGTPSVECFTPTDTPAPVDTPTFTAIPTETETPTDAPNCSNAGAECNQRPCCAGGCSGGECVCVPAGLGFSVCAACGGASEPCCTARRAQAA